MNVVGQPWTPMVGQLACCFTVTGHSRRHALEFDGRVADRKCQGSLTEGVNKRPTLTPFKKAIVH